MEVLDDDEELPWAREDDEDSEEGDDAMSERDAMWVSDERALLDEERVERHRERRRREYAALFPGARAVYLLYDASGAVLRASAVWADVAFEAGGADVAACTRLRLR